MFISPNVVFSAPSGGGADGGFQLSGDGFTFSAGGIEISAQGIDPSFFSVATNTANSDDFDPPSGEDSDGDFDSSSEVRFLVIKLTL